MSIARPPAAAFGTLELARATLEAAETRAAKVAEVRSFAVRQGGAPTIERSNGPEVIVKRDAFAILEDRSIQGRDRTRALTDSLLRANEDKAPDSAADQAHFERLVKRHAADHKWAENILARSSDVYAEAFSKVIAELR